MTGVDVIRHLEPQFAVFIQRRQRHFRDVLSLTAVVVIVVTTQNHVFASHGHSWHPFPDTVMAKIHDTDFCVGIDHDPKCRCPILPLDFLNRDTRRTGVRDEARVEINRDAAVFAGKPLQVQT